MKDDERALFAEAIALYGDQAQVNMLHEEIGELLVALNTLNRSSATGTDREAARDNALEEIEDVRVMLDQMTVLLDSTDEIQLAIRGTKTARLRQRVDNETAKRSRAQALRSPMLLGRRPT